MQGELTFEWDQVKADINLRKHAISFEDAKFVFADPLRTTGPDDRFDYREERLVAYGYIDNRLFTVVFIQGLTSQVIPIISARKANARERKRYGYREIHH